ncbi:MAG: hypothetical protein M0036_25315 [Desulfobacteraceae bacterium]|nr:hypothetical protein [Desulfobacteraceae bacterium]
MTASEQKRPPDFFEERGPDPVSAATGFGPADKTIAKKKAGFYLSEELIQRFNRHFHQMKLAGVSIENKSALLEMMMAFALEDLDKGGQSLIIKAMAVKEGQL